MLKQPGRTVGSIPSLPARSRLKAPRLLQSGLAFVYFAPFVVNRWVRPGIRYAVTNAVSSGTGPSGSSRTTAP